MDSETPIPESSLAGTPAEVAAVPPAAPAPPPAQPSTAHRIFLGPNGLRAGWSVAIFFLLLISFGLIFSLAARFVTQTLLHHHPSSSSGTVSAGSAIAGEGLIVIPLLGAGLVIALIERRRLLDYNLTGPGRVSRFLSGLAAGFVALSALVGGLYLGGWLHFGPVALSGAQIARYAATWAFAFLLVGLVEEGLTRCYLQFTLTRGINFWWALGLVSLMSAILIPQYKSESAWGVWFFAGLGLLASLILLPKRKTPRSGFWYAAWATSTFFGFMHTGNNGENWIGIFAAAAIGFVFCASIYYTGSAWWAIGCHAAWDWSETYFYGTADSGFLPQGHFLTTAPAGNALWSGGTDGPEGSLLVIPAIVLILVLVWVQYGRKKAAVLAPVESVS